MKNKFEREPICLITYSPVEKNHTYEENDWVVVKYDEKEYRGIVTSVVEGEVEVSVMIETLNGCYKWPSRDDKVFYTVENVIRKTLAPVPAGNRFFRFDD